jgi:hypothetical protein
MVFNRLQNGLINSRKLSKYFFSNTFTYFFFSNSDRGFNSENNNVSQV